MGRRALLAGLLTDAVRTRVLIAKMQEMSRQRDVDVVLGSQHSAELIEDHAGPGFSLAIRAFS